jgi:hypothetical protein
LRCFVDEVKELKKNQEECKRTKGLLEDAGVSILLWRNTCKTLENLKKTEGMFKEMGMDYWLAKTDEVLKRM